VAAEVPIHPNIPPTPPLATEPNHLATPAASNYTSNPFLNAVKGLVKILQVNAGVTLVSSLVVFIPLVAIWLLDFSMISHASSMKAPGVSVLGLMALVFFVFVLFINYFTAVTAVIAAESIKGNKVNLRHVLVRSFKHFPAVIALVIVYGLLMEVGFLLFIIPGIILMARGSLAMLVLFTEDLGPISAIKRSFALTKHHTMEMLGSTFASYLLSGSYLLAPALGTAPFVGRYEDLKLLQETGAPKPKTDWTNYLAFIVPIIFIALFGIILATVAHSLDQVKKTATNTSNSTSSSAANTSEQNASPAGVQAESQSRPVADSFIAALVANNPKVAYGLTEQHFQANMSESTLAFLFSSPQPYVTGLGYKFDGANYKSDSNGTFTNMEYEFDGSSSRYFVFLIMKQVGSQWYVYHFSGSPTYMTPYFL